MKRRAYMLTGVVAADVVWGPHDVIAIVEADDIDALMHMAGGETILVDGIAHTDTCLIVTGH
jgi:uncharacterized protein with GYD domain